MTVLLDHLLETVRCTSYEPGHQLHWSVWSTAELAAAVTRVEVSGHHVVIEVAGQPAFTWQHHDPVQLAFALERAFGPVRLDPTHHILNVDGWWFSCAPQDAVLTPCV